MSRKGRKEDKTDYNALRHQQTVVIPGWSKEDKFKLYTALREFGSNNIVSISSYLQKNPNDVRQAIEMYKKRAKACKRIPEKSAKPVPVRPELRNIPLDNWARLLMKNSKPEHLHSETSNAIKLIAELESIPKPCFVENINFKSIYLLLADAMEGKPLKENGLAQYLINRCIIDTAYFSRNISKRMNVQNILEKAMESKIGEDDLYFLFTEDLETCIVKKLITIEAYNPFNLLIDSLQTSFTQESKLFQKKNG